MKKYIFLLCLIISSNYILAKVGDCPITLKSSIPANNAEITSIKTITLDFDFTPALNYFPTTQLSEWGFLTSMGGDRRSILFKGTKENGVEVGSISINPAIAWGSEKHKASLGKTTFELNFENEILLEPNQTYTFFIPTKSLYISNINDKSKGTSTVPADIYITFKGADVAQANVVVDSYTPKKDSQLESLGKISLNMNYNNQNMSVAQGAQASLYEKENLIKSADLVVNAENKTTIDIDFGNEILYNTHNYKVIIPENSIYPVDAAQSPLTDKGNKEITLTYTGTNYKYDITAGRIKPAKNSEISYLSTVTIPLKFPEGYGLVGNINANTQTVLYKGTKEDGIIIGTYTNETNLTSLIVPIWKFDLEPNSTYTLVFAAKQILPKAQSGNTVLRETTNPEIVITYTTPATLDPITKINIQSTDPADNAEIEKIEDISLAFAPYSFEDVTYNPQITDAEMSATLYEVAEDAEKELQQVKLTIANENGTYKAQGKVGRNLYEGKTYKLRIPAGYFCPSLENLAIVAANDELTLTFTGKASHYQLTAKSNIQANANLADVGIAAFYYDQNVTAAENAKATLYKEGEEAAIKEATIFAANGAIYADFCTESVPYATEEGAAYRLELPEGAIVSEGDAELMNQAVSVAFNGPALTEYVSLSYSTDNTTTQTEVVKGNTASYAFNLEPDWEIQSLLFNGTEVKGDVEAGIYTTPALTADATLEAILHYAGSTYEEGPGTGIIAPDGTNLKAYSSDGNVVIEGLRANEDVVTVYSIGGSVLQHFTATNAVATITLPANTHYLVKVNSTMMKIFNRPKS